MTHFERGDHVELAERLIAELRGDSRIVADEGSLFVYDPLDGLYHPIDPSRQSQIVQKLAGSPVGEKGTPLKLRASDVGGALKLAYDQVAEPGFFAQAPAGVAFADAFATVTAEGIETRAHSPENRARYGYSFTYPANAAVPRFLQFQEDLFRDDEDKHEKILFWQEFGGACLLGIATTYQQCPIGKGPGANAKSTQGKILAATMPKGSTCAIAPQEFEQEYRRAMLAGKLLNVVNELPEADIIASESFKAIISGEMINGRHIRQAPFDFQPKAGHYFAANRLPGTNDQTFAFWRRFVVIGFNRTFTGGTQNPHIADEILAAELPGIVGWFLRGAVRLMRDGQYTIPASHAAELAAWRKSADPVSLFVEECTRRGNAEDGWTSAGHLYSEFRAWSERNGHRVMSSTKFGMRMKDIGLPSRHTETGAQYDLVLTRSDAGPSANSQGRSYGCN